jgi:hypothetical protein
VAGSQTALLIKGRENMYAQAAALLQQQFLKLHTSALQWQDTKLHARAQGGVHPISYSNLLTVHMIRPIVDN